MLLRLCLFIVHNCSEIRLQSHSNQAHGIRSSVSVRRFHFNGFLFYFMTDTQLIGKFPAVFKVETSFVYVINFYVHSCSFCKGQGG